MSGGADRIVRFWSFDHERELRVFAGHTDRVTAGALTADGTIIVSGSADCSIRVWSVASPDSANPFRDSPRRVGAGSLMRCRA